MDVTSLDWRKAARSGENGGNCVEVALSWRTSARSAENGGNCVEVAVVVGRD
jgi:Domain of unknown function (DUF397)